MKNLFQSLDCLSPEEMERYQKGELSDKALHRVENHLLDCPLCSAALEGSSDDRTAEDHEALAELYTKIDQRVASPTKSKPVTKVRRFNFNQIAAAIVFLAVAASAVLYYRADNNLPIGNKDLALRGAIESNVSSTHPEGWRLYQNGNYQASLTYFQNALANQSEDAIAQLMAGLSAWQTDNLEDAVSHLSIARFNGEDFYEEASWSLAQVYLKQGKSKAAKEILEDLSRSTNRLYQEKAKDLLQQLTE